MKCCFSIGSDINDKMNNFWTNSSVEKQYNVVFNNEAKSSKLFLAIIKLKN